MPFALEMIYKILTQVHFDCISPLLYTCLAMNKLLSLPTKSFFFISICLSARLLRNCRPSQTKGNGVTVVSWENLFTSTISTTVT